MDGFTAGVLDRERATASFDVDALREVVTKGRDKILAKYQAELFDRAPFDDQALDSFLSYQELFSKQMERVTEAFNIIRDNPKFMAIHMKQKVKMQDLFEHNGVFLHFTMMLNYLKTQGTPAQQKKWLPRARQGEFLAAYAQTELGHGSNVRGLETTATLDLATQEWEVHSPTLTSLKWWPTGMYACTHALVFAQLVIKGVSYGFHGFMVQLRRSDGTTMPGVELGEIGPKLNSTSSNIGYCRFTRVRVPIDHLFSKHSSVTPAGEYIAAPKSLSKFRYISMMLARTSIIGVAYEMTAKAATIAVRYSAVRLQGYKTPATGAAPVAEHAVLDYQMQQYRTFQALSFAYCLLWNSRYIVDYIRRVKNAIADGDESAADDLPELHATLSGMKAASTVYAHECIEECRKCCGGQGFLLSSGIAKLAPDFSEWVTVEGEQVILSLQCARFLIKAVAAVAAGAKLSETVAYIGAGDGDGKLNLTDAEGIMQALASRSRRLARRLAGQFNAAQASGMGFDAALNASAVLAVQASTAHVQYFMLLNNYKALSEYFNGAPATKAVLTRLLELHGLQVLSSNAGDLIGLIDEADVQVIDQRIAALLGRIRPDAVPLVDSFGFLDTQLKSTLGRFDGKVYEAIYDEATKNPLNGDGRPMVGWEKLSTVLDLDFLDDTAKLQRQRDPGTVSPLAQAKL